MEEKDACRTRDIPTENRPRCRYGIPLPTNFFEILQDQLNRLDSRSKKWHETFRESIAFLVFQGISWNISSHIEDENDEGSGPRFLKLLAPQSKMP